MVARSQVIAIAGASPDRTEPHVDTYPAAGTNDVYRDVVPKVFFSKPVSGVDTRAFTLVDSRGVRVPASVDQIGPGVWGLFPDSVTLKAGERYTARLRRGICTASQNCTSSDAVWNFVVSGDDARAAGDTSVPAAFRIDARILDRRR
jgi:hypothetical protein